MTGPNRPWPPAPPADFSAERKAAGQFVLPLVALAPHGSFDIHVNECNRGPNNELAVYVICECGRGYSWELKIPAAELIAWLSNHGLDIPAEEEERRVKAAGNWKESTP